MPRTTYRGSIGRELASARRSLRALEKALGRLAARIDHWTLGGVNAVSPRHRVKLTPARLKALRLHGRYLGYIRRLEPKEKAQAKALREKMGVEAAVKKAKKLASK
jgi:hypothetical protein